MILGSVSFAPLWSRGLQFWWQREALHWLTAQFLDFLWPLPLISLHNCCDCFLHFYWRENFLFVQRCSFCCRWYKNSDLVFSPFFSFFKSNVSACGQSVKWRDQGLLIDHQTHLRCLFSFYFLLDAQGRDVTLSIPQEQNLQISAQMLFKAIVL